MRSWFESVLEHIPHGEEGIIDLAPEDAFTLAKMLLKRGYAVCFTSGDLDDDIKVSWIYAGNHEDLDYADYSQVVFSHIDYIEDYPKAINGEDGEKLTF